MNRTSVALHPALALGIPGIALHQDGELTIDGERCEPQQRRLSDLLRVGDGVHLGDRTAALAAYEAGEDPVLYHAFRNFLPPREKASDRLAITGPDLPKPSARTHILADLIVYLPGTLPGGEPFRSTGHWNMPGQLEIFQTLTGRVLMLVGGRTPDGRRFLYEQVTGPGEAMVVPFGIWHVSYVLEGPAVVFNVTTDVGGEVPVPADPGQAKYERAAPIAIMARRAGESYAFTGTPEALRTWGQPVGPPNTDWLRLDGSLADLHLNASPEQLADLERQAMHAFPLR